MVQDGNIDPAFLGLVKNKPSFYIWRIENFNLVPISKEQYGKFYKGDSYIIFSASDKSNNVNPLQNKENKPSTTSKFVPRGSLEVHIHFWLGSETSQDEAATAAIKSVELDYFLGGGPIQHRETEGNESKKFLSYFKEGIRYLSGGIASGMTYVKDEFKPALYLVKGKRRIVLSQLPDVSWNHMNEGDVYILDTRDYIYVWTGRYSNNYEKIHGAKFATKIKGEHGRGHVIVIEDGQETNLTGPEEKIFNSLLPLNNKHVTPLDAAPQDDNIVRRMTHEIKLYRCSDESGTLKVTEIKNGPFSQKDLNSNDSFILDNAPHDIWVWIGKKASKKEREEALRNGQGFISKKGYPPHTQVSRIVDGGEPLEFKTLFQDWREKDQTIGFGKKTTPKSGRTTVQTKFDAAELHQRPLLAAETQMMDDGKGQKEVWRVKNFDLIEVPDTMHGEFFMGDCYVILYAYESKGANYIVYYWIGSEASADEAGTAALKAVELDDKLDGRAVQVRVTQGKEPPHFMAIFGGRMAIYEGGFASGFDGSTGRDVGKKGSYMLQVRCTSNSMGAKAIEVDFRAGCLNSNDCFIITTPNQTFVWCGKGSTGDEREMAKMLSKRSIGEPVLVSEGHEKPEFWNVLGGKEDYASAPNLREENSVHAPRLFHITNKSGILRAEEILSFGQEDLMEDDVMLLDTWSFIFLWVGKRANREEQRGCESLAIEYLKTDPAARSKDTPIIKIKQGFEPPNFTGFFGAWNNNLWNEDKTYADICKQLEDTSPGATILVTPSDTTTNGEAPRRTYPITILLSNDVDKLPLEVDPTKKEDYLCKTDFEKLFGMDRKKFDTMPEWKRINLKKKAGIF